jgi:hypothetical protein
MNPIRVAIVVAFVGASLWAFSLYIPVKLGMAPEDASMFVAETRKNLADARKSAEPIDLTDAKKLEADTRYWKAENALENGIAEGFILGAALQKEILIVTIAGVAWVLAGMVKRTV